MDASRLVETFSGKRVSSNRPIVGGDVYTQTAGIHADGDKKNNLYANPILPERFGRERVYALGKLSGKASITQNLKVLGIELSPEKESILTDKIKELGESKEKLTAADLPFLINDLFGVENRLNFVVKDVVVTTSLHGKPTAELELEYCGQQYRAKGEGDGGYDAFMNALKDLMTRLDLELPMLADYEVRIPPGGKTDALVEAVITWRKDGGKNFRTTGVHSDQTLAAVKATEKMLNLLVAGSVQSVSGL
jgi:D-citramalate synthase